MGLVHPTPRKRRATAEAAWKRLERLFEKLAPPIRKDLAPAAKKRAITQLEKTIRRELPDEVKESLLCHDGQREKAAGCVFNNRLLAVDSIGKYWEMSRGTDFDAVPQKRVRSFPADAVQLCESHPGWIPLVADWNGNYIGVDLAPNLGGQRGQVIVFDRSERYHYVLAPSWADFLANYADDLQDGHFELIIHDDDASNPEFRFHEAQGDTIQAIGNRLMAEEGQGKRKKEKVKR